MISYETYASAALPWLLEPANPGVRYLALRDLVGLPGSDAELAAARKEAHQRTPIAAILESMEPDGWWVRPGPGYNPKYRSAVWSLILLAQLGARLEEDERIHIACQRFLDHNLTRHGIISTSPAPSGTVDCLQGNMCAALLDLGCTDERLSLAFDWLARSQTGEGIAPLSDKAAAVRYYAYKCGPGFACGVNNSQPCAWGAAKVMLAFSRLPAHQRTRQVQAAIQLGIDFFLDNHLEKAAFPTRMGEKPSRNWWKFGFPVFYITDILQAAEALILLGCARDPRLRPTLEIIESKQVQPGRWALEYNYEGKTWVGFGEPRKASKWVTLRALRVLKSAQEGD